MIAPASIPSPTVGVLYLGPVPLRAYALCILAGIVVAIWLTGRRLQARGYDKELVLDVATWAVPFGIIGGRIYHVITTPEPYWGEHGNPLDALKIWNGGHLGGHCVWRPGRLDRVPPGGPAVRGVRRRCRPRRGLRSGSGSPRELV